MSVDEALKQLSFVERKGSAIVKEVEEPVTSFTLKLDFCFHAHMLLNATKDSNCLYSALYCIVDMLTVHVIYLCNEGVRY